MFSAEFVFGRKHFRSKTISAESFFGRTIFRLKTISTEKFSAERIFGRKTFRSKNFSVENFAVRIAEGGSNGGVPWGGSPPGPSDGNFA